MMIRCRECGRPLKEGQEVYGEFAAYYHELASRVTFSVTKPHEVYADTLRHTNCGEAGNASLS